LARDVPAFLQRPNISPKALAEQFDWSNAEALRQGDTAALPSHMVPEVLAASNLDEVRALALALDISPVPVAIALLAKAASATDRNAGRVFRAVLGNADPAMVEAALRAIGLELFTDETQAAD
jgi:hypothetical protein